MYNLHWGKHVPPRTRWIEKYDPDGIDAVLPVVLIRDPLYWMQSMCKTGYNAEWKKGLHGRYVWVAKRLPGGFENPCLTLSPHAVDSAGAPTWSQRRTSGLR